MNLESDRDVSVSCSCPVCCGGTARGVTAALVRGLQEGRGGAGM